MKKYTLNPKEELSMKRIINELPENLKGLVWSEDVNENTEKVASLEITTGNI